NGGGGFALDHRPGHRSQPRLGEADRQPACWWRAQTSAPLLQQQPPSCWRPRTPTVRQGVGGGPPRQPAMSYPVTTAASVATIGVVALSLRDRKPRTTLWPSLTTNLTSQMDEHLAHSARVKLS